MSKLTIQKKLKSLCLVTLGGFTTYAAVSIYKGNETFYKNYVIPAVHLLDAENAHKLAVIASQYRLFPKSHHKDSEILKVTVFGKEFENPVGIAAGFDKDGKGILGLHDIGFGFVEIGSVTPEPQSGNDKPRVFRLSEDLGVINRYGFNSEGHDAVFKRVCDVKNTNFNGIIGINLGKNKTSPDAIEDYVAGVEKFGAVADYLVINISSPNTFGLRSLQNKKALTELLEAVVKAKNNLPNPPPLLLKLAPDLSAEEREDVATVIQEQNCQVDGLIISNTTVQRPQFLISRKNEEGGLSGQPLKDLSTQMIADMYKLTNKTVPIIGVGGISSGIDAYQKIKAGASLIQLYTAIVFEGPTIVTKVKRELENLVEKDGYRSIKDAVGKDVD